MRAAVVVLLAVATEAAAESVRGIRVDATAPVAVRGGVMMLPLVAERPGDRWPGSLRMTLEDGRRLDARIVWIEPGPIAAWSRWSLDTPGLAVRWIEPGDDTSVVGAGAPYLIAELPADGAGALAVGDQVLEAEWIDPPRDEPRARPRGRLGFADNPGYPDRHSPFAYWRWVLLAERLDLEPPPPDRYGDPGALVARHAAGLWRAGLARLAETNPGIAAHCRDLLTQRCADGDVTFAAWVADPAKTSTLLGLLLDPRKRDEPLHRSILAWADAQDLVLVWPEPADAERVRVAIANPTFDDMVAQFIWSDADRIPVAADLAPGGVTRVNLERPEAEGRDRNDLPGLMGPREPAPDVLLMSIEGRRERFVVAPGTQRARPPAVRLSPLRPALSLLGLQRRGAGVAQPQATEAALRRREGRWEVFFDCLRPGDPRGAAELPDDADLDDVVGTEAALLLVGAGDRTVTVVIPERGPWRTLDGASAPGLEVHRRSYRDRWLCRVVLPDAWVPLDAPLQLGVVRTHGGTGELESAPYAVLPWRRDPGRVSVDLTTWDE